MKRILTVFTVTLVAAVWMTGSWFFFNSIAVGAQGSATASAADVSKAGSKDESMAAEHCGEHWKGHHGDWKGRHGHHHFWKKLNLTDAQKKEMFSIRLEERAKMKPLVQKLKAGRDELRALPKGQFDEAKVRAIAKGQADTIADMIVAKEHMKSRIFAVLTPEQRTKVEQMCEKWTARHGKKPEQKD
ncbi:MAG: Spy/CpxP family protein refolding chaperone [Syntrophobacteraceae bacterium]|jgi:Spy/CpxP family protein refolding chaperone